MLDTQTAMRVVAGFDCGSDGLARKSAELVLGLLAHSAEPFSRNQYTPGHMTCTALVLHPVEPLVLFMHHHRLNRWLLPGGHVEPDDDSLSAAAAREAVEETCVALDPEFEPFLAGIDVHGIPPKKAEPFHLHHDLIWCFRALSDRIETTDEAPGVAWADAARWDEMGIADSIRNAIGRAQARA
jgi:8-oxo-dGTP pyrophosphatase MutT (NUDIX family)